MFSQRLEWLGAAGENLSLRAGLRGVEKETLRVDAQGRLAQSPHPTGLGAALTHPHITTDYSEALLELVTPPVAENWQTLQQLFEIHAFVYRQIEAERLWPVSMPCEIDGDGSIPIAHYGPSNTGMFRTIYRRGLGHRYGRAMQAIAGVHFNYSPPEQLWPAWRDWHRDARTLQQLRSEALMGLVRNYYRNAWLVIYLFGASPALSRSFVPGHGSDLLEPLDDQTLFAPFATSLRMSDIGYQNKSQARLRIGANSTAEYIQGLVDAVTTIEADYERIGVCVDGEYRQLNANRLQIENEYYSTMRPKPPPGENRTTIGLREHGVQYVEVRTLDLSPSDPVGLNQAQMRFLEVLLLYCLLSDSPAIDDSEQEEISQRDLITAREGRRPGLELPFGDTTMTIPARAEQLAMPLRELAALLDDRGDGKSADYGASVTAALAACTEPAMTPSARLLDSLRDERASFIDYSREIAEHHREYFLSTAIDPKRLSEQQRLAAESLESARQLESASTEPFAAYLAGFMARV